MGLFEVSVTVGAWVSTTIVCAAGLTVLPARSRAVSVAVYAASGTMTPPPSVPSQITSTLEPVPVKVRTVMALLLSLSHLVLRKVYEVTDVFIEVNPRHVAFYSRALGFVVAAGERICERVHAPSVLLRAELDALEERIALMGRKHTMRPLLAHAA